LAGIDDLAEDVAIDRRVERRADPLVLGEGAFAISPLAMLKVMP